MNKFDMKPLISSVLLSLLILLPPTNPSNVIAEADKEPTIDRIPIELLPRNKAKPVSFEGAEIRGALNASDRAELELLIGRLPRVLGKIKSVTTCWDDYVVAAKIIRGRRCIYCTKSPVDEWQVVRMELFFED